MPTDSPLDLLVVLPDLGDGGPTRVAATLVRAWAERGRSVAIATLFEAETAERPPPRIERFALGSSGGPPGSAAAGLAGEPIRPSALGTPVVRLSALLRARRPRVVLALVDRANVVAVLACREVGLPVVISERHDPLRNALPVPWDRLRRQVYPQADVVTANTRGALAVLARDVARERLRWIPNPVAAPVPVPDAGEREPLVVAVGRLVPEKGHDVLLDASAALPDDLRRWRLALVGRGAAEPALRRRAARLGIEQRIEWVGHVEDPAPWLARASVFALPSRHEGLPNALLEAMSAALPVIVTDGSPGPLEWVRDGDGGLVVPAGDAPSLARAITRLARDDALRRRLGATAREATRACAIEDVLAAWDEAFEAARSRSTSATAPRRSFPVESAGQGGVTT